jgi:hypothetical protein
MTKTPMTEKKILVKTVMTTAAAVTTGTMMERKQALNMMTLPRRLTSPAEILEFLL